jgi:hypothetical protein
MRRIPNFVLRRNRQNSYAEEQAQGYGPPKPAGRTCARCGKPEGDHFAGSCDDWKPFEPKPERAA